MYHSSNKQRMLNELIRWDLSASQRQRLLGLPEQTLYTLWSHQITFRELMHYHGSNDFLERLLELLPPKLNEFF